MEPNATIVPTIHIIPLKDKEEYQCHILEISLHKKGIKTNIQLPNQKDVKHSNNNLELFLGTWKPFKLFAQKYDKYGIHIGFSGQKAWVYCGPELLDRKDMQSFQKDLVDIIEYLNKKFNLGLKKEQQLNTPGEQFSDAILSALNIINPALLFINAVISIESDGDNDKKSYWERLKDNTVDSVSTRTVNSSAKYLFGNLIFIRDVLDDYLKENSIISAEEE